MNLLIMDNAVIQTVESNSNITQNDILPKFIVCMEYIYCIQLG